MLSLLKFFLTKCVLCACSASFSIPRSTMTSLLRGYTSICFQSCFSQRSEQRNIRGKAEMKDRLKGGVGQCKPLFFDCMSVLCKGFFLWCIRQKMFQTRTEVHRSTQVWMWKCFNITTLFTRWKDCYLARRRPDRESSLALTSSTFQQTAMSDLVLSLRKKKKDIVYCMILTNCSRKKGRDEAASNVSPTGEESQTAVTK